jgi:hypothetical protein
VVIGSDDAQNKLFAYDISLNENINGEKTLTFSLPSKYRNEEGDLLDNPLLPYLTAERKVKLRDGELVYTGSSAKDIIDSLQDEDTDDIWYDFIIKEISEDGEKHVNTYTCKELHVNELGKNGYSVLLDDTLGNNYGTLQELAERALEGSGWSVVTGQYAAWERVNEPLFQTRLTEDINISLKGLGKVSNKTISKIFDGDIIYTFYSALEYTDTGWKFKKDLQQHQIMYNDGKAITQYDDQYIVVDDDDLNYTT